MKSLYLIRHAKSSKEDPTLRDFDRPLSERGIHEAAFMAALLKFKHVQPDLIISSPAIRAISTAKNFAKALKFPEDNIQLENSIYEAEPSDLYEIIHQISDQFETVLMFGHNPSLSVFADAYWKESSVNIPTCGIVCFKLASEQWIKFNPDHVTLVKSWSPTDFS